MQHAPVAASDIPNADVVDDVGSSAVFNQPPRCGLRPPDFNPHDGGWVFFFFFVQNLRVPRMMQPKALQEPKYLLKEVNGVQTRRCTC